MNSFRHLIQDFLHGAWDKMNSIFDSHTAYIAHRNVYAEKRTGQKLKTESSSAIRAQNWAGH